MVVKSIHLSSRDYVLQPALAWGVILGFTTFSALAALIGAGSIVRLCFPIGAFLVSLFLYKRYPILCLGFIWWIWFLTPWFRRFVDYRGGVSDANVTILLAPILATLVMAITLIQYLPKYFEEEGLPYALLLLSLSYGLLIGLAYSQFGDLSYLDGETGHKIASNVNSQGVIIQYLQLITPILLSFHVFANWRYFPQYQKNLQCVFRWGVIVTGVYGIIQFLVAPEWDRIWLRTAISMGATSFGVPEPLGIRVFSTLNSPGPYAQFLAAGLILLLADKKILTFPASVVGYLTFLLTLVRSCWGIWFLSLLIYSSSLKLKSMIRLFLMSLFLIIFVYSIASVEPFSDIIGARLTTISDVQSDGSFLERIRTYGDLTIFVLSQPIGFGLGLSSLDSGFLYIFLSLGWLGGSLFMAGSFMILFNLLKNEGIFNSVFINATRAIVLGTFPAILLGNIFEGFGGCLFWYFAGITLAGKKYYQEKI
jgi:hypothetical protein